MEMVIKLISYFSSKIKNFDKYLHLLIGTLVYILVGKYLGTLPALAATAAIARWKEMFDKKHPDKHTYDGWDAFATLLGAVIGQAILTFYPGFPIVDTILTFILKGI